VTTSADTIVTARWSLPELIERGTDVTLVLRLYRAGALLTPTWARVTLVDTAGTAVIDAQLASRLGGGTTSAEYDVADDVTATSTLSDGWLLTWEATVSGVTHVFRTDAMLVRHRLAPVVTEADLYRRQPALDPSSAGAITSATDYASQLDEAWTLIQARLIAAGQRPALVLSPSALRAVHLSLTLALIYEGLATRNQSAYLEMSREYRREYAAAWRDLRLVYDQGDSGRLSSAGDRRGGSPSLWLGVAERRWPDRRLT